MIRRLLLAGAAFSAACATGSRGTPAVAAPALTPAPGAPTTAPATEAPSAHHADVVRYGPSALRYVVHRRLHIQQALGDQTQAQDVGARIFVATAITGPADSIGYPATFLVDSIVADSGTPPPIVEQHYKGAQACVRGTRGSARRVRETHWRQTARWRSPWSSSSGTFGTSCHGCRSAG